MLTENPHCEQGLEMRQTEASFATRLVLLDHLEKATIIMMYFRQTEQTAVMGGLFTKGHFCLVTLCW